MRYFDFKGKKISSLGLGMMRFECDSEGKIYEDKLAQMLDTAIDGGINYFDTAWGYHDGKSEVMVGRYLSRYERSSYFLADKFPAYDLSNFGKVEEIFEKQLEKCNTDFFDFYLFHTLTKGNLEYYLDDTKYGTASYLFEQKRKGRIRHLGVSVHCSLDVLKKFFDAYGDEIEFCQIQLNYLDWHYQKANEKVEYLHSIGVPVWVMEPVRGGRLATLPEAAKKTLERFRQGETVPSWAFRFLQSVEGIGVVLSGMSNQAQLKENIKIFSEYKPLSKEEFETLVGIGDKMVESGVQPCTACSYCTSHCPVGLDIPRLMALYNDRSFSGSAEAARESIKTLPDGKKPSDCIACRSCEGVCPQQIKISDMLKELCQK